MGSKNRLEYHVVLSTKWHRPALAGLEEKLYAALEHAAFGQEFEFVEMGSEKGTHVHLIVRARPTLSVEQIVDRIKQLTTWELWAKERPTLEKYYWDGKRRLWSKGYFVDSLGRVSRDVILDYVRRQA